MCPLHVEVRPFVKFMAEGNFPEARKILDRLMPLSGVLGFLCDGPCTAHCRRNTVDGAVNLPMLERACAELSAFVKPMSMPGSGRKAAVVGSGLSGLSAAFELAKKGYEITLFHAGAPGGRLLSLPTKQLPRNALPDALEMLERLRVTFAELPVFSSGRLESALADFPAVYVGLDDEAVQSSEYGTALLEGGLPDPLTLAARGTDVFAGGLPADAGPSFILEAADGKKGAASVDRVVKGVPAASAREKEAVYLSTLYTDVSSAAGNPAVIPADPAAPTAAEAVAEAGRCLQCRCLECVKHCPYLARYKGYPKRYAREFYNNLSIVHGQRKANTQINSCAECGLCAVLCPYDADMGAFCADVRREMVRDKRMPPRHHEFALQDMEFSNSAEVAFFRLEPGRSECGWAFFPGCQVPASRPEQTEAAYAHLRHALPGGVGFFFSCCGAPARWSGRPALTASTAAALREQWTINGKPVLIVACSSCLAFFQAELPGIPARSLWETLAEFPLPDAAGPAGRTLALHDPCTARHAAPMQENVRKLLAAVGQEVEELALSGKQTRCCGYGGLAAYADRETGDLYSLSRAGDTRNTLLSYCVVCRDRLRAAGKPSLHLFDLLFPREDAGQAALRPPPGISARQETRLSFRRSLLQRLWHEPPVRNPLMDEILLRIDDAVAEKMEMRRILRDDVKAVLLYAGEHGAMFSNAASGRSLACLRPRQVTFWVEYSREEDGPYRIHDAYCHRMVVPGVPGEGAPSPCTVEGYAVKGGRM
jgi:Fe-S oxidoreductase